MAITQKEARNAGLARYTTGKPCVHGHVAERFTYSGNCVACAKAVRTSVKKNTARALVAQGLAVVEIIVPVHQVEYAKAMALALCLEAGKTPPMETPAPAVLPAPDASRTDVLAKIAETRRTVIGGSGA